LEENPEILTAKLDELFIKKNRSCSSHGGLAFLIDNRLYFEQIDTGNAVFSSWEYNFIKVNTGEYDNKQVMPTSGPN
jgi:hypothetical protein